MKGTKEKANNTIDHLRLSVSWPVDQRARLKLWCDKRGVSMNDAILMIVADRLDSDEVKR